MSQTKQPDNSRARVLTVERLEQLLDAYGGVPERWPDAEREAALRLVQRSPELRARWEQAAELDRLLDSFETEAPSPLFAAGVLHGAPRRRAAHVWRRTFAAVVPLAAAAAVVLWLVSGQPQQTATTLTSLSIGEYESPTDVLLGAYGVDVYAAMPSIGCSESTLGCPDVKATGGPVSRRQLGERMRA